MHSVCVRGSGTVGGPLVNEGAHSVGASQIVACHRDGLSRGRREPSRAQDGKGDLFGASREDKPNGASTHRMGRHPIGCGFGRRRPARHWLSGDRDPRSPSRRVLGMAMGLEFL